MAKYGRTATQSSSQSCQCPDFLFFQVDPRDLVDGKVPADAIEDPFADDPPRDPRLIKLTEKPCNAETPKDSLMSWMTPIETFFTRNHLYVYSILAFDCWRLM